MNEEEYFRKNYPDSCYGDKPLSPHWDFFQDGVEFGERQSEKKITELKLKLEALEGQTPWKDIKDKSEVIGKLIKAKEILHKVCYEFGIYNKDLMEEAKQFLNSEVEK